MNEVTEILKVDEAGRVRTPRERQERIVDELERSGMTGMQFATHIGVKYPTLMNWVGRRKRERREKEPAGEGTRWIEALVEGAGAGVVVEIPGGLILKIGSAADVELAARVLRALGYGRPC